MDRDKSKGSLKMITTINFEQTIFTLPPENEPLLCYTKWDEFKILTFDGSHFCDELNGIIFPLTYAPLWGALPTLKTKTTK